MPDPNPPNLEPRFEQMLQIARSIEGFMAETNVAIWDSFLSFQASDGIQGHLLEIGVFKGRSASILCQHRRPGEELWLVDFSSFIEEARKNLARLHDGSARFLRCKSSDLWRQPEIGDKRRGFRWIHIDGEHTGQAVNNDLELAADLLTDEGLVCVDDFFNPAYPQISAAVFSWLTVRPFEFEMVLCGENKAYLARTANAHRYFSLLRSDLARELKSRGVRHLTIFKTSPSGDFNGWGIQQRRGDRDYYGLDANPDQIC